VAEILDLAEKRREIMARRGFQSWTGRFGEPFGGETCIEHLSDKTLGMLIQGGEDSSLPLYELIMGILGLGGGAKFYYLETPDKMMVMDITLFLMDQLRFEAMRRIGWIENHSTLHVPIVSLVREFPCRFSAVKHQTPPLSPDHPLFPEYEVAFESDRASYTRRLIPEAIRIFEQRIEQT
jgi:hypothetical protein